MKNNKLIISAAGSGKTSLLINESLKVTREKVLITTFTQSNEEEICNKFFKINGFIPENIEIQTWFSFLLKHGARPYQSYLYDKEITGLILVNDQSAKYSNQNDIQKHYFTDRQKIYSDKISKFVLKCNEKGKGCVIDRISRIYSHIFIDEVQDFAGYDLEILKMLFKSNSITLLVGDPRQGTYSTNNASKYQKFRKSEIVSFFKKIPNEIEIDNTSLNINYRCMQKICDFADKLFPDFPCSTSGNFCLTGHDGVFLVKQKDVESYLDTFNPMQLRDSRKTIVNLKFKVLNFGESKGLSFDRVLIYPTKPFCAWLEDNLSELAPISRSKFYVAITRARYSVGIIYDYNKRPKINGVSIYL